MTSKKILLNVTPAATDVIVCTTPTDSEYVIIDRGCESVLWQCLNCTAEGARSGICKLFEPRAKNRNDIVRRATTFKQGKT